MIDAQIIAVSTERASSGNITIQFFAKIETDTGRPVKFRIMEEDGNVLDIADEYVSSPVEISKFFFLNNRSSFETTSYSILMYVEEQNGSNITIQKTIDGFSINSVNRLNFNTFEWSIKNMTKIPIYSLMQIVDRTTGVVVLNSTQERKDLGNGASFYRYEFPSLDSLPDGQYSYRLKYYSLDENWNRFFPNENGVAFEIRENVAPELKIRDTKIRKDLLNFTLTSRVLISDFEMDDVQFEITDNFGNKLREMPNFTYSPRLERISAEYPLLKFNSTRLTVTVHVNDKFYGHKVASETIKLYNIYGLHRERDMFRWQFRNYSNKQISMQPEVLDFDGNVIQKGGISRIRDSFDYMLVQDFEKFLVVRDYYRFRLRVWCDEEDWSEYYPYEYGIQFTRRDHEPPKITINNASIYRDLDNVTYLKLDADITDKENDHILYTIKDDVGYVIRQTTQYVTTPHHIDIQPKYDSIGSLETQITLSVVDDNNGTASETVMARAFRFNNLQQKKGHIFNWSVDNYSYTPLDYYLMVTKKVTTIDAETNLPVDSYVEVYRSEKYTQPMTIRPSYKEHRISPKLRKGDYYYKLVADVPSKYSYPNDIGYAFSTEDNTLPQIEVDYIEVTRDSETNFLVRIAGNITDIDEDLVDVKVYDQYGTILYKSATPEPTPLRFNISHVYNSATFEVAKLYLTIEALDEGNGLNSHTEDINLFEIQNLFKSGQEFYWSVRNYSKIPINMQLEILDSEGNPAGAGSVIKTGTQTIFREFRDILDIYSYDEGNYFYRVKITSDTANWVTYYPNINGFPFEIIDNQIPRVRDITSEVNRTGTKQYTIRMKGHVTDGDNDQVYVTIKE